MPLLIYKVYMMCLLFIFIKKTLMLGLFNKYD